MTSSSVFFLPCSCFWKQFFRLAVVCSKYFIGYCCQIQSICISAELTIYTPLFVKWILPNVCVFLNTTKNLVLSLSFLYSCVILRCNGDINVNIFISFLGCTFHCSWSNFTLLVQLAVAFNKNIFRLKKKYNKSVYYLYTSLKCQKNLCYNLSHTFFINIARLLLKVFVCPSSKTSIMKRKLLSKKSWSVVDNMRKPSRHTKKPKDSSWE